MQMIQSGDLDPRIMITHRVTIDDVANVYRVFDKKDPKDGMMKVFVQTRFSAPPAEGTPQLKKIES